MWVKQAYAVLILITLLTLAIVIGFDVQYMNIAQSRIESAALAAGWAGFSAINLETMANRNSISIIDSRNIQLNKSVAKAITEKYLKKNFMLSDDLYPLDGSFINDHSRKVSYDVTVFNKGDSDNPCEFTTVMITLKMPFQFGPGSVLKVYGNKVIYANYNTFLIESQKE